MRSQHPVNIALILILLFAIAGVTWLYLTPDQPLESSQSGDPQAVSVRLQTITAQDFPNTIEALGTTQANKSVAITSEVASIITDIHFAPGETVSAGEVLVTLEDAEARADLAAAQAALVESRTQYERSARLSDSGAISESQLQQLEAQMNADAARVNAAKARLADHTIRAPFAGRTGLRQVSPGTLMQPGTVITTLDDINPIWLDFSVPESFIGTLQSGQSVTAHSVAYPDRAFTGTVRGIDTRVDPMSRALTVRAAIDNPQGLLKPGMFLTVELLRQEEQALLIP
ncbi:MAG TPA: efflux RND transporter periplasmic adaptor subunit, partial [Gammaproteobacteria bacterium]|nr:efflux RND transporter periplasmic adaptor subunit [Gammaproteobacteria bacterium]